MMRRENVLSLPLLLLACFGCCCSASFSATLAAEGNSAQLLLNAKLYLRKLSEAAVLTIQSPDGDVVLCVPREKQPAFDHPLLQNHTLQESPSYVPTVIEEHVLATKSSPPHSTTSANFSSSLFGTQLWHQKGRCPENTVPIRRPSTSDLIAPHLARQYRRNPNSTINSTDTLLTLDVTPSTGHEYVVAQLERDPIYGAYGVFNVWKPTIAIPREMSITQLWLVAGRYSGTFLDTIEAGVTVEPSAYGDSNTRFFIFWTNNYYQSSGCLDLRCPGFVHVSSDMLLGGAMVPVSIYGGPQFEVQPIFIWKDTTTGNWWLQVAGTNVGYWPAILFKNGLQEKATKAQWGGEITNFASGGLHTTTQMGSGHFSNEGYGKASYVRSLQVVDSSFSLSSDPGSMEYFSTNPTCYSMTQASNQNWGVAFFLGGPGLNANCL